MFCMKNRLISALLALVMLLAAIPTVRAAAFEDTETHWAKEYIDEAVGLDLFKGVSETMFDPEDTMTRGMFVTVLGRLEGIDLDFWSSDDAPRFFDDVPATQYYAPYVSWAVCNGIADGMSPTEFSPDASITREQMAKLIAYYIQHMRHELTAPQDAEIPETFADAEQVSDWAKDSVDVLRQMGIMNGLPDENGGVSFQPAKFSTRAECAAVFCRINGALVRNENPPAQPSAISFPEATASVAAGGTLQLKPTILPEEAQFSDLVWRSSDPDILSVDANGLVTYVGDGTAVISVYTPNGLHAECSISQYEPILPTEITFPVAITYITLNGTMQLKPTILPEDAEVTELTWKSSDPNILTVDENGLVTCVGFGTAVISAETVNGLRAECSISCVEHLASAAETKTEKCLRLFGEAVDDPKSYYAGEDGYYDVEEDYRRAEADMVEVTLKVWDLNGDGEKYTRYFTIKVHKNIAATVQQIFCEIYEGEEQFPIHYLGGFSHGGRSEHTIGTAIDINPDENYYYNANSGEQVGDYWKPGEDPYSIPLDGEVARIFKKYGFSQGIWNTTVDYMHFSYFGT